MIANVICVSGYECVCVCVCVCVCMCVCVCVYVYVCECDWVLGWGYINQKKLISKVKRT